MAGTRPPQAGMTLIELLIAVVIGALVLGALHSVVSLGLRAQTEGAQANELLYQGQFALERMVDKARSALPGVVIAATPTVSTTCGGVGAPVAVAGGSTVTLPAGRSIPANGSCTLTVNVTAAVGGSYINTLPANALATNNGNNARQAVASLSVIPPGPTFPTLGKAFSPASINAGGVSTLTLTLSNPNGLNATLTASLIDTLPGGPAGVVIAATPNVSTTCGGVGAPVAVAGSSTVTLPAGRSIPANGSCTLTVNVTAANQGSIPLGWVNTLPANALVTSNGNNAAQAVAGLTVIPSGASRPRLGKAFSPASINAGGVSTLTVTLSNPDNSVVTLTAPLIDTLPSVARQPLTTPAAGTTGNWFSPVMYCRNGSNQLIETTTADAGCTGSVVIATNVTAFLAQPISSTGPVDKPAGTLSLTLTHSAAPQPVTLATSVRIGGGTL